MGKSILFLRVSTQKQELESQELFVRRMANSDGISDSDILPPIQYKENATELDEDDRQGIQDLYHTIENRNDIDAVYISELSRLSRKPNVLYKIRDFLLEKKIQLVCGKPSFKLIDENGKLDEMAGLVFAIFGAFAEQETIEKKERFARGKEQKALEGKYVGGNIPFGYTVLSDKTIVKDECIDDNGNHYGDAITVKLVFDLYEKGLSQSKIARELSSKGIKQKNGKKIQIDLVNHILKNESYVGELSEKTKYIAKNRITKKNKEYFKYPRKYPQIISKEQFDRCRKIADDNNTGNGVSKVRNIYFAENLMKCISCGSKISASGSKDTYHCYSAYKPLSIWEYEHHNVEKCDNKQSISINILDSLLWYISAGCEYFFIEYSSDEEIESTKQQILNIKSKIDVVNKQLLELKKKKDRIVDSYIEGNLIQEKYNIKLSELKKEQSDLENSIVEYNNHIAKLDDMIKSMKHKLDYDDEEVTDANSIFNELLEELGNEQKLYYKIYHGISDDKMRYDIIHRHIESVTMDKVDLWYKFKSGWKFSHAKRFVIELVYREAEFPNIQLENGGYISILHIPNGCNGTIYLLEEGEVSSPQRTLIDNYAQIKYNNDDEVVELEMLDVNYLKRFVDSRKIQRRLKEKEKIFNGVEGYLRIEDIMKMANINYSVVRYAIKKGKLKAKSVQRKFFIHPTDAEEYVNSLKQKEG